MLNKYTVYFLLSGIVLSPACFAFEREIAITIDDLPFVGTTHNIPGNLKREHDRFLKIVQSLEEYKVPATGFVIAGTIEKGQWDLLEQFNKDGRIIGNHTYTHANLNRTDAKKYIADIEHADQTLIPLMPGPKYFRFPYLAEGKGEVKQEVHDYLMSLGYIVAPVTIDSKDFKFNEQLLAINWRNRGEHLNQIKKRYLDYIWNQTERSEKRAHDKPIKQILLIHANLLNSHFLGDILQMYKDHEYHFISLDEALKSTTTQVSLTKPPSPSTKANDDQTSILR